MWESQKRTVSKVSYSSRSVKKNLNFPVSRKLTYGKHYFETTGMSRSRQNVLMVSLNLYIDIKNIYHTNAPSNIATCPTNNFDVFNFLTDIKNCSKTTKKYFHSPLLYKFASSWAPLCCGPHRGLNAFSWGTGATAQFAFGSSSSMEFSRICCSVLTGANRLFATEQVIGSTKSSFTRGEQLNGNAMLVNCLGIISGVTAHSSAFY